MRLRTLLCTLLGLAFVLSACETELEPTPELSLATRGAVDLLPPDAVAVGKLDLQAVRANPALDPFEDGAIGDELSGEAAARWQTFLDATGFDPADDLDEAYLAVRETDGEPSMSLAVYARFDRERLERYMTTELAGKLTAETYRGLSVYRTSEGEPMYVALANDNLVVASNARAQLEGMLDRLQNGAAGSLSADPLVQRVAAGDVWFVARDRSDVAPAGFGTDEAARLAAVVGEVALTVSVTDAGVDGTGYLVPRSSASADDVAALVRGALAALRGSGELDAEQLQAIDDVRVRTEQDRVVVSGAVSSAMLQSLMSR